MTSSRTSLRMAYFGHNRRDTAFVRRIRGFVEAGVDVTTYSYRRDGEPAEPGPNWPNVDLGHADHGKFLRRIGLYFLALKTVIGARRQLADADVVYARNLDIFLFAWFAMGIAKLGRRAPIYVYECLDVHEALLGNGLKARLLRAAERRVLARADLLVVSSPGFIDHFFTPTQRYSGPTHWIENKLHFPNHVVARPALQVDEAAKADPLTIGWVGIIRCQRTLELLVNVATALPQHVHIRIAGLVSYFLLPDFDQSIEALPNIEFRGPYDWPSGLADAYQGTDLVWSQELSWSGGNSDWLIPNRVYEASYFGVPSLAIESTQTGRIVAQRELGFVLPEASANVLIEFLRNLPADELSAARSRLLSRPERDFVLQQQDTEDLLQAIEDAGSARKRQA
ncbi:MAG: glycosyltransferase [Gammaproteobacteria bacterium]